MEIKRPGVSPEKVKKTAWSIYKTAWSIYKNGLEFHPRKSKKRPGVFKKTARTINVNLLTVKPTLREKVTIRKIPYEVLALDLIVRIEEYLRARRRKWPGINWRC